MGIFEKLSNIVIYNLLVSYANSKYSGLNKSSNGRDLHGHFKN